MDEQLQNQLHQANLRLSTILARDISYLDSHAITAHQNDIQTCINLIECLKKLLNPSISTRRERIGLTSPTPTPPPPPPSLPPPPPFPTSLPPRLVRTERVLSRDQMILPPIASFSTQDELREYCRLWAFEHGYDFVKRGNDGFNKWGLECGCYGQTQNNRRLGDVRHRRQGSRKTGCKFKITIVLHEGDPDVEDDDIWTIQYPRTLHPHNHDPTPFGTAVANDRRIARDKRIQQRIITEATAGVKPRQILALLRTEFPFSYQTSDDIKNLLSRAREIRVSQRTTIEATLAELDKRGTTCCTEALE